MYIWTEIVTFKLKSRQILPPPPNSSTWTGRVSSTTNRSLSLRFLRVVLKMGITTPFAANSNFSKKTRPCKHQASIISCLPPLVSQPNSETLTPSSRLGFCREDLILSSKHGMYICPYPDSLLLGYLLKTALFSGWNQNLSYQLFKPQASQMLCPEKRGKWTHVLYKLWGWKGKFCF